jgi:hypothetical protein
MMRLDDAVAAVLVLACPLTFVVEPDAEPEAGREVAVLLDSSEWGPWSGTRAGLMVRSKDVSAFMGELEMKEAGAWCELGREARVC